MKDCAKVFDIKLINRKYFWEFIQFTKIWYSIEKMDLDRLTYRPFDLPTIWPTDHLTYRPLDLPTIWPTDHLTYRPFDLPTIWPTDRLTYRSFDLPTIWPTDHLTYRPFDLPNMNESLEFLLKFNIQTYFSWLI